MKLNRRLRWDIGVLVIGTAALFASFVLDSWFLELFVELKTPLLDYVFGWITSVLSLVTVLLVMTTLFMWEEHKRDWILPLWSAFVFAFIISYAIKFLVARERPFEAFQILGFEDYSFPSTHVAISFSVVPILDREYPMLKWFWIAFAGLVALSRLYLQAHYLSDIIAGIMLGYFLGRLILYLKTNYDLFP